MNEKGKALQNVNELSDLSKRFLFILDKKRVSAYKLEKEKTGITQSQISHIKSGRNQPSNDIIESLLNYFPDVNRVWLLTGYGSLDEELEVGIHEEKTDSKEESVYKLLESKLDDIDKKITTNSAVLVKGQDLQEKDYKLLKSKYEKQEKIIEEQTKDIKDIKEMLMTLLKSKAT